MIFETATPVMVTVSHMIPSISILACLLVYPMVAIATSRKRSK